MVNPFFKIKFMETIGAAQVVVQPVFNGIVCCLISIVKPFFIVGNRLFKIGKLFIVQSDNVIRFGNKSFVVDLVGLIQCFFGEIQRFFTLQVEHVITGSSNHFRNLFLGYFSSLAVSKLGK